MRKRMVDLVDDLLKKGINLTPAVKEFEKVFIHSALKRARGNKTKAAGGFAPKPCLLLTTCHHKTGARRSVVLPYRRDGDRYLVVGSHGGRPTDAIWAMNLRAHPDCRARVGWSGIDAEAREAQGDERDRIWGIVTDDGSYLGYEKMAFPRVIPVFVLSRRTSK